MTKLSLNNNLQGFLNKKDKPAKFIEISKVGTRTSKKVNMPKKQNTLTEYQSQFKAKQSIKKYYGDLSENTLNNIIKKSKTSSMGENNKSIISEIEKRLDVIVFRLGFARSILEARTLIKEGQVKINDKLVHSKSFSKSVEIGSKISVEPSNKTYLAKIKHTKFNLIKLPTHLFLPTSIQPSNLEGINSLTSLSDKRSTTLNIIKDNEAKIILSQPYGNPQGKPNNLNQITAKGLLEGYFIKNPLESEIYLPYNYPINKLRMIVN